LSRALSINPIGSFRASSLRADIHRVRNGGDGTAISTHVYGTDLSRIGTSARRYYDLGRARALGSLEWTVSEWSRQLWGR
jgi:hypothetical protein